MGCPRLPDARRLAPASNDGLSRPGLTARTPGHQLGNCFRSCGHRRHQRRARPLANATHSFHAVAPPAVGAPVAVSGGSPPAPSPSSRARPPRSVRRSLFRGARKWLLYRLRLPSPGSTRACQSLLWRRNGRPSARRHGLLSGLRAGWSPPWPQSTDELSRLDLEVSRFQPGSELARMATDGAGARVVSERLAEAVSVALEAARWTGGRVDPTVGNALVELGYDRDFSLLADASGTASSHQRGSSHPRGHHTRG